MDSYFESSAGGKIYTHEWECTTSEPKAVLFVFHGYAEHCRRYDKHAEMFASRGYVVVAADMIGHGRSEGPRGQFSNIEHVISDADTFVQTVKAKYPDLPRLVFSHSLGCGVIIEAILKNPSLVQGAVFIAPFCRPDSNANNACNKMLLKVLTKTMPGMPVASFDRNHLTHDAEWAKSIHDDPYNYGGRVSACTGTSILKLLSELKLDELRVPFLALHGADDSLVNPSCSRALQKECPSEDKTVEFIEGSYHQLHNEIGEFQEPVMKKVVDWLDTHVANI